MSENILENDINQNHEEPEGSERFSLANLASDKSDLDILRSTRLESRTQILDEDLSDKLGRQARVLGGGLVDGTASGLKDAASDPVTILKAGASVGMGALLTYMSARKGNMRLAAQGTGVVLGGVFAKDLYDHGVVANSILKDSWNDPSNEEADRARMAHTLGPLASDTIIFTAGGLTGMRYAQKKWGGAPTTLTGEESLSVMGTIRNKLTALTESPKAKTRLETPKPASEPAYVEFMQREMTMKGFESEAISLTRLPADAPLAQAVSKSRNSVGKIESLAYSEEGLSGSMATAVSISKDGKLVTNQHQIENAISIVVFDPKGNPHTAHVLKTGNVREMDLAILQLDKPSSYKAFEPIKIAEAGPEENAMIALLGHSDGLNAMHVSRGTYGGVARTRGHFYQCNANVAAGNCGSAMVNMQGELMGIMKGDIGNSQRGVLAVPAEYIKSMLASAEAPRTNTVTGPRGRLLETMKPHEISYTIEDPGKARGTIDEIFGLGPNRNTPDDFFHQRARVTSLASENGSQELILGTTLNRMTGEVSVRPVSINGKAIGASEQWRLPELNLKAREGEASLSSSQIGEVPANPQAFHGKPPITVTEKWPGLEIKLSDAELNLSFVEGEAIMKSVNDPLGILTRGLELKGGRPSYLSTLEPTIVSPAKPIAPAAEAVTGKTRTESRFRIGDIARGASSIGLAPAGRLTLESLTR